MATPRDMDPKLKEEKPEAKNDLDSSALLRAEDENAVSDVREDDETQYIVHRENVMDDNGNPSHKEHRVPVSEWPEYEKKNNL